MFQDTRYKRKKMQKRKAKKNEEKVPLKGDADLSIEAHFNVDLYYRVMLRQSAK